MIRACRVNGGTTNAYRILVGKSEGKMPVGRQKCRWADDIKMGHER
jgi:hypothetical protein